MYKLVLIRHGESVWNKENRFTGWTDVDLSERGVEEAHRGGKQLRESGYIFDLAYTSVLKRAIRTLWIVLDEMDQMWIPVINSWRLNERHYGALQGLNKAETAAKFGDQQVLVWRRSYDVPPPELTEDDFALSRQGSALCRVEQGRAAADRVAQTDSGSFRALLGEHHFERRAGRQRVVIVAHGNSLRALVKYLDNISDEEIMGLNIPTGVPLVYELDAELKPIQHYYLGDPEEIAKAAAAVAAQGKAK